MEKPTTAVAAVMSWRQAWKYEGVGCPGSTDPHDTDQLAKWANELAAAEHTQLRSLMQDDEEHARLLACADEHDKSAQKFS